MLLQFLALLVVQISAFKPPDPVNLVKNREHLKEHLKESLGIDDKTADQWLQENDEHMQFFLVHDYDHNSKLDGLELLKSIIHHEHQHREGHDEKKEEPQQDPEQFASFIDTLMDDNDTNKDGYLDYMEYMAFVKRQQAEVAKYDTQRDST